MDAQIHIIIELGIKVSSKPVHRSRLCHFKLQRQESSVVNFAIYLFEGRGKGKKMSPGGGKTKPKEQENEGTNFRQSPGLDEQT